VRFDGVRMERLMQAVGASGQNVMAVALNDYTTQNSVVEADVGQL
jgi:hypothetical protein